MSRACKVCNCTESYCEACVRFTGQPCRWVGPRLCSACQSVEPKGRWAKGEKLWVWRLLRGCCVYLVQRRLYHFAKGDKRPCRWVGFDFVIGNLVWRVAAGSGLDSLLMRGLIKPDGTCTGYTDKPDAYGFRLTEAAKQRATQGAKP